MAKLIDSIRLFLLRLLFPAYVLADIQIEAKLQHISVITLVRNVLERYLRILSLRLNDRMGHRRKLNKVDLNEPMTPEEIADADEAMRIFREEDR